MEGFFIVHIFIIHEIHHHRTSVEFIKGAMV
jgi:hypothetical protein